MTSPLRLIVLCALLPALLQADSIENSILDSLAPLGVKSTRPSDYWVELALLPSKQNPDFFGKDKFSKNKPFKVAIPGFWIELHQPSEHYYQRSRAEKDFSKQSKYGFYYALPEPRNLLEISKDIEKIKKISKTESLKSAKLKKSATGIIEKRSLSEKRGIWVEYPFGAVELPPEEALPSNRVAKQAWYVLTKYFSGPQKQVRITQMCPIDLSLTVADETVLSENCYLGREFHANNRPAHPSPIRSWYLRQSSMGELFEGVTNAEFCPLMLENLNDAEIFNQNDCLDNVSLSPSHFLVERGIAQY